MEVAGVAAAALVAFAGASSRLRTTSGVRSYWLSFFVSLTVEPRFAETS